jgi:hypothetical protein
MFDLKSFASSSWDGNPSEPMGRFLRHHVGVCRYLLPQPSPKQVPQEATQSSCFSPPHITRSTSILSFHSLISFHSRRSSAIKTCISFRTLSFSKSYYSDLLSRGSCAVRSRVRCHLMLDVCLRDPPSSLYVGTRECPDTRRYRRHMPPSRSLTSVLRFSP